MQSQVKYYEKVFLFVFIISMVIGGIYFSGKEDLPYLTKEKKLKVIAQRSYGLKPGSLVKMKDLEIGTVESVNLNEQNKVEIVFKIKKKYHHKLRKNSVASVYTPPIIGSSEIIITCGSKKFDELKSGDIVTLKEPDTDMMSELSNIPKKITPALDKLDKILKNFKTISDDLAQGRGSLGKFLQDEQIYDQTLTMITELNKFATSIQPVIDNFAKASEKLPEITKGVDRILADFSKMQKDAEGITKNVKDTTESVNTIVKRIERGEGTVGKILTDEGLHNEVKKTLSSTSNILHKIDSVNITPSLDASFHGGQNTVVSKITTSISAGKTQCLKVGGAFVGYKKENLKTKPEVLFSQGIPAKGIIVSCGVMEGQVGGGVDFKLKDKIFTVEGRKTSSSDIYDNNMRGFILRSYFGQKIGDNIKLKIGATDILNKPSLSGGIIVGGLDIE